MIKDIICKSNVLEELLTANDFEFLKQNCKIQEELEIELKTADLKRNKIIEKIKLIEINEKEIEGTNPKKLREYINSAESAFESINFVIRNFADILEELNEIEKSILELIEKKESDDSINVFNEVDKINEKINLYKIKQSKIEHENLKYNILITNFLEKKLDNINELNDNSNNKFDINENKQQIYKDVKIIDNLILRVSEKENKVYLPYTMQEINYFLENYPQEYKNAHDVIEKEFITDISIYNKHPVLARFRESYSLIRNKEMKSSVDALKFAMNIMLKNEINPTIIAAVKSQQQLESYMNCLEKNKLNEFNYFDIIFEVNPI